MCTSSSSWHVFNTFLINWWDKTTTNLKWPFYLKSIAATSEIQYNAFQMDERGSIGESHLGF